MPRGEHPNSRANLKTNKERTKKEWAQIAAEGGKASGKVRRQKAELKEIAQAWLDSKIKDKNGTVLSGGEALIQFAVKEAARGNVRAMAFIRDTAGQKPIEVASINVNKPDEEAVQRMVEKLHEHVAEQRRRDPI